MTWRFLVRPSWIFGHIVVIAIAVGMASLGFWQLDRLEQRKAINSEIRAAASAPALEVESSVTAREMTPFRAVRLTGVPRPDQAVYVRYPIFRGLSGYYVLVPFQFADGTSVLVNRGWVSRDDGRDDGRTASAGAVETVTGVSQKSESTPNDLVAQTEGTPPVPTITAVDVDAVASLSGAAFAPSWVQQTGVQRPGAPTLLDLPETTEGSHFSYALQWFSFAAIGVIGWLVMLWRQARTSDV